VFKKVLGKSKQVLAPSPQPRRCRMAGGSYMGRWRHDQVLLALENQIEHTDIFIDKRKQENLASERTRAGLGFKELKRSSTRCATVRRPHSCPHIFSDSDRRSPFSARMERAMSGVMRHIGGDPSLADIDGYSSARSIHPKPPNYRAEGSYVAEPLDMQVSLYTPSVGSTGVVAGLPAALEAMSVMPKRDALPPVHPACIHVNSRLCVQTEESPTSRILKRGEPTRRRSATGWSRSSPCLPGAGRGGVTSRCRSHLGTRARPTR
jgi:hypothetical protein